jgi:hypothetical protein
VGIFLLIPVGYIWLGGIESFALFLMLKKRKLRLSLVQQCAHALPTVAIFIHPVPTSTVGISLVSSQPLIMITCNAENSIFIMNECWVGIRKFKQAQSLIFLKNLKNNTLLFPGYLTFCDTEDI